MVPKGAPAAQDQVEDPEVGAVVPGVEAVLVEAAEPAAQGQVEGPEVGAVVPGVETVLVGQDQVEDPEAGAQEVVPEEEVVLVEAAVQAAQGQVEDLEVGAVVQEVMLAEEVDQVVPVEEHNTPVLLTHAGLIRNNCS